MSEDQSLAVYFNAEELDGAKRYVQEFHGKFLLSDELGRKDAALLGLYMLCNKEKKSEVEADTAREFIIRQLGAHSSDYSKAVYELKSERLLGENQGKLTPTFKGLKKIRELLAESSKHQFTTTSAGTDFEIPSIGTPNSLREAITNLFTSPWGAEPRKLADVMEALETNALYYPKAAVATELAKLVKTGTLRRMKKDGSFAYVSAKKNSA